MWLLEDSELIKESLLKSKQISHKKVRGQRSQGGNKFNIYHISSGETRVGLGVWMLVWRKKDILKASRAFSISWPPSLSFSSASSSTTTSSSSIAFSWARTAFTGPWTGAMPLPPAAIQFSSEFPWDWLQVHEVAEASSSALSHFILSTTGLSEISDRWELSVDGLAIKPAVIQVNHRFLCIFLTAELHIDISHQVIS